MSGRVWLEKRRRSVSASVPVEVTETVIRREGQEIAALAEGDPLRYALKLPLNELQSLRQALSPVLDCQPRARQVLEAIIEYKQEAGTDSQPSVETAEG
jgi:hypothetical protein